MSTTDRVKTVAPIDAADWPVVLDGELMRAGEAMIPAGDDGLIRGDGAFDAFPVLGGRPFARAAISTASSGRVPRWTCPVRASRSSPTSTSC